MSQFLKSISKSVLTSVGMVAEAAAPPQPRKAAQQQGQKSKGPAKPVSPDDPINLLNKSSLMYRRNAWFFRKMLKNQLMGYDDIDAMTRDVLRVDAQKGITLNVDRTLQTPTHMVKGGLSMTAFGEKKSKQGQDDEPTHPINMSGELSYFIDGSSIMGSIDDECFQARGHVQFDRFVYSGMMNASHSGEGDMVMHSLNFPFGVSPAAIKHQMTPHGSVTIFNVATCFDIFNLGLEGVHVHDNTSYWNFKIGSKSFNDPVFTVDGNLGEPPSHNSEWVVHGSTNGELGFALMVGERDGNGLGGEIDYNLGSGELSWKLATSLSLDSGYDVALSFNEDKTLTCAVDTKFWGLPSLSLGFSGSINPDLDVRGGLEINYSTTTYDFPVEQL